MGTKMNLTGQKFGRWTAIERRDRQRKDGGWRGAWLCRCECGVEKIVQQDALLKGTSRSCGCLQKELQSKKQKTHGEAHTKLYNIWSAIKRRCYNTHSKEYPHYGGRGITMCDEWRCSYDSFKQWCLDNGYDGVLTIDRIDNNGNYCPENCRFSTKKEQSNNRRSNRVYEYNGESHNVTEWSEILGINAKKLFCRLYAGWSFERAIQE